MKTTEQVEREANLNMCVSQLIALVELLGGRHMVELMLSRPWKRVAKTGDIIFRIEGWIKRNGGDVKTTLLPKMNVSEKAMQILESISDEAWMNLAPDMKDQYGNYHTVLLLRTWYSEDEIESYSKEKKLMEMTPALALMICLMEGDYKYHLRHMGVRHIIFMHTPIDGECLCLDVDFGGLTTWKINDFTCAGGGLMFGVPPPTVIPPTN